MALTHVYAVIGGKLRNVEVGDIANMSYLPHLFCKLCGEDVSFVPAYYRCAFFRHTPNPGKPCPEKSESYGDGVPLPVRRRTSTSDFFVRIDSHRLQNSCPQIALEMALPPMNPSERAELISSDARFEIACNGQGIATYCANRLMERGRTYVPMDLVVAESYDLSAKGKLWSNLFPRFNRSVNGFDKEGMLFSMETGRRIPFQSEVFVDVSYVWIGKTLNFPFYDSDIETECIDELGKGWVAYRVKALQHSNQAIVSFIKAGAALCVVGDIAYPLWPAFVRSGDMVSMDLEARKFWGAKADAKKGVVPKEISSNGEIRSTSIPKDLLYPRPFLYSPYGQDKVARDVDIWKESFSGCPVMPVVEIWDPDRTGNDKCVPFGEFDALPLRRRLCFKSITEGHIEICAANGMQQRRFLKSQSLVQIDVAYGLTIKVFLGLDFIGQIVYRKPHSNQDGVDVLSRTERRWLAIGESQGGESHPLYHLVSRVANCPELHGRMVVLARKGKGWPKIAAVVRKYLNRNK